MRKHKIVSMDNRVAKLVGELRRNANHVPDKHAGVADVGATNYFHASRDVAVAFHPRTERSNSDGSIGRCFQFVDAFP